MYEDEYGRDDEVLGLDIDREQALQHYCANALGTVKRYAGTNVWFEVYWGKQYLCSVERIMACIPNI
jgi:hypothetical protein